MGRRYGLQLRGERYCGDTSKMEVHDLDNEDGSPSGCQIDIIIAAGRARAFFPDALLVAHREGFTDCARCLGASQNSLSLKKDPGESKIDRSDLR